MTKDRARLRGKFLIEGTLCLKSPLIIGSGEKEDLDIIVIRNAEGKPYIPSTSFTGALRHFFNERLATEGDSNQFDYFWGSRKGGRLSPENDSYQQSALTIEDLKAMGDPSITFRDGVSIDPSTGTARGKMKYDYEIVEPGSEFALRAWITLRESFCRRTFLQIMASLIKPLTEGKIPLGAMTTKGFGRCCLKDYAAYEYDFSKKGDAFAWLRGQARKEQTIALPFNEAFALNNENLCLEAVFALRTSLIIKSYRENPADLDAVHIKSRGKNVLPGTSIKGALRSRAVKIINTLGGNSEEMGKGLFGWAADRTDDSRKKIKSRFWVEETHIDNTVEEIQFRTRIDRFSGGVIKTGLFDTQPLWPQEGGKEEQVKIIIEIKKYKDWEAGLLLLLLKDLWTGDLPLGGDKSIGRGVLRGLWARMEMGQKEVFAIQAVASPGTGDNHRSRTLNIKGQENMETLVRTFLKECQRGVSNN